MDLADVPEEYRLYSPKGDHVGKRNGRYFDKRQLESRGKGQGSAFEYLMDARKRSGVKTALQNWSRRNGPTQSTRHGIDRALEHLNTPNDQMLTPQQVKEIHDAYKHAKGVSIGSLPTAHPRQNPFGTVEEQIARTTPRRSTSAPPLRGHAPIPGSTPSPAPSPATAPNDDASHMQRLGLEQHHINKAREYLATHSPSIVTRRIERTLVNPLSSWNVADADYIRNVASVQSGNGLVTNSPGNTLAPPPRSQYPDVTATDGSSPETEEDARRFCERNMDPASGNARFVRNTLEGLNTPPAKRTDEHHGLIQEAARRQRLQRPNGVTPEDRRMISAFPATPPTPQPAPDRSSTAASRGNSPSHHTFYIEGSGTYQHRHKFQQYTRRGGNASRDAHWDSAHRRWTFPEHLRGEMESYVRQHSDVLSLGSLPSLTGSRSSPAVTPPAPSSSPVASSTESVGDIINSNWRAQGHVTESPKIVGQHGVIHKVQRQVISDSQTRKHDITVYSHLSSEDLRRLHNEMETTARSNIANLPPSGDRSTLEYMIDQALGYTQSGLVIQGRYQDRNGTGKTYRYAVARDPVTKKITGAVSYHVEGRGYGRRVYVHYLGSIRAKGGGLGSALLHEIFDYGKKEGCSYVNLTPARNAIDLYRGIGFTYGSDGMTYQLNQWRGTNGVPDEGNLSTNTSGRSQIGV